MKKLNEILAHRNVSELPQPAGLASEVIDRIWLRMAEIYGHKWVSSYGESDADGTWAKGLADMGMDELKAGFIACVENGEAWPPSLPEFRVLCKPKQRENEAMYRIPESRRLEKKLTPEARANGRSHVAALQGLIKRNA